jgi:hypothetical protein
MKNLPLQRQGRISLALYKYAAAFRFQVIQKRFYAFSPFIASHVRKTIFNTLH